MILKEKVKAKTTEVYELGLASITFIGIASGMARLKGTRTYIAVQNLVRTIF